MTTTPHRSGTATPDVHEGELSGSSFVPAAPDSAPAADRNRVARSLFNTIPLVLAGSMAMSLNLSLPLPSADAHEKRRVDDKASPSELGKSIREALAAAHAASTAEALSIGTVTTAAAAPTSYTVVAGDSVSGIAARYGLATASVLALNGLSWKSVIYPGQVLSLVNPAAAPVRSTPTPAPTATTRYTIKSGDSVSAIAAKFGISTQNLLSANGLGLTSIIYAGSTLAIPGSSSAPASVSMAPVAQAAPDRTVGKTAHVIKSGETIASIARSYGTSIQSVLTANGLGWSSIIYSGRTLAIPAVVVVTPGLSGVTPLTQEMAQNARSIIAVGRSLGVNDHGLTIALATAMQESSLRNLDYGDRDSLGLFQQRPSQGWGTAAQVRDPQHAARLFFGGPSGPNRGVTAGLLDISGWQSMSLTRAAQAVQRSGHPDAYAKWETSAKAWLAALS